MTLQANAVCWSAGGRRILEEVTLAAAPGAFVGLLGPNGSGKSSLLRLLAGLRQPDSGSVDVAGIAIGTSSRRWLAQRLALVEQDAGTDQDPTVREVIDLGRIPHRRAWAPAGPADALAGRRAAEACDVADRLDQRYSTLSGGERQRVQIARALAQEPEVLLLDEPTNHLDVRHQLELLHLVRRTSVTALAALHDLNLAASFCDRLVVLSRGRVVAAGTPDEVLTSELIEQVYGVRTRITNDDEGINVRFLPGIGTAARWGR